MKRQGIFWIMTLLLIGVIALSISGTAMSHGNRNLEIEEEYYRQLEQEYVQQVRRYLAECGYENSGVMLTHVVTEDGCREYTVTVHHGRLDKLTEEDRREIGKSILEIAFEVPGCDFLQEFLVS